MEDLISTEDVARFLGVTRPTVIKYIQEGRLNAMRTGKAYKITKHDLIGFAEGIGMDETRLSGLDTFLKKRNKKTGTLRPRQSPSPLVLHEPPLPMVRDVDVLYFLSVRANGGSGEIIMRVKLSKFFVGRHSLASLSIQDPYISTIHATLMYKDHFVEVLDQSTNGTFIGQSLLRSGDSRVLGDGDQLRVGKTVLTLISSERVDLYLGSDLSAQEFHAGKSRGSMLDAVGEPS